MDSITCDAKPIPHMPPLFCVLAPLLPTAAGVCEGGYGKQTVQVIPHPLTQPISLQLPILH